MTGNKYFHNSFFGWLQNISAPKSYIYGALTGSNVFAYLRVKFRSWKLSGWFSYSCHILVVLCHAHIQFPKKWHIFFEAAWARSWLLEVKPFAFIEWFHYSTFGAKIGVPLASSSVLPAAPYLKFLSLLLTCDVTKYWETRVGRTEN